MTVPTYVGLSDYFLKLALRTGFQGLCRCSEFAHVTNQTLFQTRCPLMCRCCLNPPFRFCVSVITWFVNKLLPKAPVLIPVLNWATLLGEVAMATVRSRRFLNLRILRSSENRHSRCCCFVTCYTVIGRASLGNFFYSFLNTQNTSSSMLWAVSRNFILQLFTAIFIKYCAKCKKYN